MNSDSTVYPRSFKSAALSVRRANFNKEFEYQRRATLG